MSARVAGAVPAPAAAAGGVRVLVREGFASEQGVGPVMFIPAGWEASQSGPALAGQTMTAVESSKHTAYTEEGRGKIPCDTCYAVQHTLLATQHKGRGGHTHQLRWRCRPALLISSPAMASPNRRASSCAAASPLCAATSRWCSSVASCGAQGGGKPAAGGQVRVNRV